MPEVYFSDIDLTVTAEVGETLLAVAQRVGAPAGSHCGGVCACSKCHLYVEAGPAVNAPEEDEEDMLELAAQERRPTSRLGCQTKLCAEGTVHVAISEESFRAYLDHHPEERDHMVARWRTRTTTQ